MKTIKLWDGINLVTDNGSVFCESPAELWEHIHTTQDMQIEITRQLFCFGHLDLTDACNGKLCVLHVVPATNS